MRASLARQDRTDGVIEDARSPASSALGEDFVELIKAEVTSCVANDENLVMTSFDLAVRESLYMLWVNLEFSP